MRNVTCPVIKDERRFDGGQRDGHAMMIAQRGRFIAGAVDDRGGNQPPGSQLLGVKTGSAPSSVIWISAETLGHPMTLAQTLLFTAFVHVFRQEPSTVVDYAGRVLRICEEHRIQSLRGPALCANGWALGVSAASEKGLAQIAQALNSYGPWGHQHMLLAWRADAQLAIGKPEAALASVVAGLTVVEKQGGSAA